MFTLSSKKYEMPSPEQALPGRATPLFSFDPKHAVLGSSMVALYPEETQKMLVGMGCFWGAERLFWQQPGVYTTAVGYSAGYTPNPTYEEVCSGMTGHNEVVLIVYYPEKITYQQLLALFWENHNPTQGMRQANDTGTQYRSGIYTFSETQLEQATDTKQRYQEKLSQFGKNLVVTTEIMPAKTVYFAEGYHQQYLAKNPGGYCNLQTRQKTGYPSLCDS